MPKFKVSSLDLTISTGLLATDEDHPTGPRVYLRTSNGKINALLLLANNTVLSAEIHTALAPLDITVYQHRNAAQTSAFNRLSASTSAARAALHLDSGYEGAYELHTRSPGETSVEENPDVGDPLGLGRLRTVMREPTERRAHLWGNVFWSEAGELGGMGFHYGEHIGRGCGTVSGREYGSELYSTKPGSNQACLAVQIGVMLSLDFTVQLDTVYFCCNFARLYSMIGYPLLLL
ncbi:hypothetical protein DFH07DRAFT_772397 [Mycena maculata]|uniref:Uncharacterized protein n=1 Tax=Mycena maculata TaxID=230809 RepID=A0AAD7NGE4_9AGAR|nr:hypothetical protein DFH07DRAFT_772397 [Mycena maculata]